MEQKPRIGLDYIAFTGIPGIDSQHSELIFMLDAFTDNLKKDDPDADFIYNSMDGILSFMKSHFVTEEKLIEMMGFTKITDHKAQHKECIELFLKELKTLNEKDFTKAKLIQFIRAFRDTAIVHFSISDGDYVNYMEKLLSGRGKRDSIVSNARAVAV